MHTLLLFPPDYAAWRARRDDFCKLGCGGDCAAVRADLHTGRASDLPALESLRFEWLAKHSCWADSEARWGKHRRWFDRRRAGGWATLYESWCGRLFGRVGSDLADWVGR